MFKINQAQDPFEIVSARNIIFNNNQNRSTLPENRDTILPNSEIIDKTKNKQNNTKRNQHNNSSSLEKNNEDITNKIIAESRDILKVTREEQLENERLCGLFDCNEAELASFQWTPDQEIDFRVNFLLNAGDLHNRIVESLKITSDENIFRCKHCVFNTYSVLLLTLHSQSHGGFVAKASSISTEADANRNSEGVETFHCEMGGLLLILFQFY